MQQAPWEKTKFGQRVHDFFDWLDSFNQDKLTAAYWTVFLVIMLLAVVMAALK